MRIYKLFNRLVQQKTNSGSGKIVFLLILALNFALSFFLIPVIGEITVIINLPFLWIINLAYSGLFSILSTVVVYIYNSLIIILKHQISSPFAIVMHGAAYAGSLFILTLLRQTMLNLIEYNKSLSRTIEINRKTRKQLSASEKRFRILFENSPIGFVLMESQDNGDWNIVDCNNAFSLMNGYEKKELIGKSIDILHSAPVDLEERRAVTARLDSSTVYSGEYTHIKKNGDHILIEYRLTMVNINGRDLIIGIDFDITERMDLENRLKKMNEILEHKVTERTAELNTALEAQKEMVRERDILLQEIHHRVKNNLQLIQSLLALQAESADDEKLGTMLMDSRNRIMSMAMIHERLYQSNNLAELDIYDYIEDLASSIYNSNRPAGKDIGFFLDVEHINIPIDQVIPLGLIIAEIMSNSLKHAFTECSCGRVEISLHAEGNKLLLKMSDNGKGLGKDGTKADSTLGFLLIDSLTLQLKGECRRNNGNGLAYEIEFSMN